MTTFFYHIHSGTIEMNIGQNDNIASNSQLKLGLGISGQKRNQERVVFFNICDVVNKPPPCQTVSYCNIDRRLRGGIMRK